MARSDLPSGFAARGGIWQQVLAGLILSARERRAWHSSVNSSPDAEPWLLRRLAAKDAARRWLGERGLAIAPSDIVIADAPGGGLRATGEWVSIVGNAIDVMVRTGEGDTVATVYPRDGREGAQVTRGAKPALPVSQL